MNITCDRCGEECADENFPPAYGEWKGCTLCQDCFDWVEFDADAIADEALSEDF